MMKAPVLKKRKKEKERDKQSRIETCLFRKLVNGKVQESPNTVEEIHIMIYIYIG